jgi:N-carbamoylputrescine amidase
VNELLAGFATSTPFLLFEFQANPASQTKNQKYMPSENKMSTIKIAGIQTSCQQDTQVNLRRTLEMIEQAASAGANVVCLQELFNNLYFCQSETHEHFQLGESIPGPTTVALADVARRLKIVIIVPIFERRTAGLFHNTAAVIDADGKLLGSYRKMHIPDDPSFMEKFYFTPGDKGFLNWETQFGDMGVCICWDQWYPEAARLTALRGSSVLFYPTAIGWLAEDKQAYGESQLAAWQTMMRSHAIANGVFVVAVNRVGVESNIEFWGNSFICDPYGNIIAEASRESDAILLADCDLSLIETARTHWPFLRDRRIDAYDDLKRRLID